MVDETRFLQNSVIENLAGSTDFISEIASAFYAYEASSPDYDVEQIAAELAKREGELNKVDRVKFELDVFVKDMLDRHRHNQVKVPVIAAPQVAQVVAPAGEENASASTCAVAVLREVPIKTKPSVMVGDILKAILKTGLLTSTDDLTHACNEIVKVAALAKTPLGDLDETSKMSSGVGKMLLSKMHVKDVVSISSPVLLHKLLQYQFNFSIESTFKIGDNGKWVPVKEEDYKETAFKGVVQIGDVDVEMLGKKGIHYFIHVSYNDITLKFDGYGDGDVSQVAEFVNMWNAAATKAQIKYVEIPNDEREAVDYLLALYDFKRADKVWKVAKALGS